jgi:hypothetical protein
MRRLLALLFVPFLALGQSQTFSVVRLDTVRSRIPVRAVIIDDTLEAKLVRVLNATMDSSVSALGGKFRGLKVEADQIIGGNLNVGGTINGQTISSAANFTGTLTANGLITAAGNEFKSTSGSVDVRIGAETFAANQGAAGTVSNHPFDLYTNSTRRLRIGADGSFDFQGNTIASGAITSTGSSSFDSPTLVVDAVNHRVGIKTTAPSEGLEVAGRILSSGDVASLQTKSRNGGPTTWTLYDPNATELQLDQSGFGTVMTWKNGGNVAIGTTGPWLKLVVQVSGDDRIVLNQTAATNYGYQWATNGTRDWDAYVDPSNKDLHFYSQTVGEVMLLKKSTGNVGIRTTSPNRTLEVVGQVAVSGTSGSFDLYERGTSNLAWGLYVPSGSFRDLRFYAYQGAGDLFTIQEGGNVAIGTTDPLGYKLRVNGTGLFDGNLTVGGDITDADGKKIRSATASGNFQSGYSLDYNSSVANQSTLYIDNIVARGSLRVHYFEKDILRVINGKVMISDGTTLRSDFTIPAVDVTGTLNVKDPVFVENDIIEIDEYSEKNGSMTLMKIILYAASSGVTGQTSFTVTCKSIGVGTAGDIIRTGATAARKGNTSNTARQGFIVLDANTTAVPRIDIFSGFNTYNYSGSPVIRLGELDASAQFGLQGKVGGTEVFRLDNTSALIAGWDFDATSITKLLNTTSGYYVNLSVNANGGRPAITAGWGDGTNVPTSGANFIIMGGATYQASSNGQFSTTGWASGSTDGGMVINVGGQTIFTAGKRGSVSGVSFAGWDATSTKFGKTVSGVETYLSASNRWFAVNANSYDIVRIGDFSGSPSTISPVEGFSNNFDDNSNGFTLTSSGSLTVSRNAGTGVLQAVSVASSATTAYMRKNHVSGMTGKVLKVQWDYFFDNNTAAIFDSVVVKLCWSPSASAETNSPTADQVISKWSWGGTLNTTAITDVLEGYIPSNAQTVWVVVAIARNSSVGTNTFYFDNFVMSSYNNASTWVNTSGLRVYTHALQDMNLQAQGVSAIPELRSVFLRVGTGNTDWYFWKSPSDNNYLYLYYNNTKLGYFNSSTGAYTAVSDIRLKNSVAALDTVTEGMRKLQPIAYRYKWQGTREPLVYGFDAQNVAESFSNMVFKNAEDGTLSLDYQQFHALLVKYAQELDARISILESKVGR